uniref:FERM domain-containing protein n=1 Tax=Panagrolaimus sp. PS1159 TaxID=55785 RepID=A0AC35GCY7_9BILA
MANHGLSSQSLLSRVTSTLRHSSPINIIVQILDDVDSCDEITLEFKSNATGQAVLDAACQELNIVERDFFGLRYQDNNKSGFWLDLAKPVNKQLKGNSIFLSFRFRFYPLHPSLLKEGNTRYQLFVQLRRDLLHGRLYCTQNDAIRLAGFIFQEKISDYHQQLRGMDYAVAKREFANLAASIETYGFDPYVVKDETQSRDLVVGATCRGILVFSKKQLLKNIPWKYLSMIDYIGKELKIYPTKDFIEHGNGGASSSILDTTNSTMNSDISILYIRSDSPTKKAQFKFICPSKTFAKYLWRYLLSHKTFFTAGEARLVEPKFSSPQVPFLLRDQHFDQSIAFTRFSSPKQHSRSDISPPNPVEESIIQSSELQLNSVHSSLKQSESPNTLTTFTSPVSIAAGTSTYVGSQALDFAFTPSKGSDSPLNTTLESQISSKTAVQTLQDDSEETAAQPLTTTIEQQTNNGGTRASNEAIEEHTVVKKIIRTVLTVFMFLIIISSFAVMVFEANDGKSVKWTQDIYPISSFRQIVYDPSKDAVQQIFRRFY